MSGDPGKRLLAKIRQVRKDPADSEAVHDARVSARRLAAVAAFCHSLGRRWAELGVRLAKYVRRLGKVSNLDAAMDLLRKGPAAEAKVRAALSQRADRKRRKELARLSDWLTSERVRRLKSTLQDLPEPTPPAGPAALAPQLQEILRLEVKGRPMADADRAHDLRRAIRMLRYQWELVTKAGAMPENAAIRDLFVRLQDSAGGWRDRTLLERLAERERGAAAGMRRRLATEKRKLASDFEKSLAELVRTMPDLLGQPRRAPSAPPTRPPR